jgi:phage gp29-like protein
MLENMGSASWGAFPAGTTIELKEAVKAGADNPQIALLALVDRIIDLLILGQTLTSDARDKGTQALGTVHADVLSGRKKALLNWAVEVINEQLIPGIIRVNFGNDDECPYILSGNEDQADAKVWVDVMGKALESGVPIPRGFYYEQLGIPMPEEGADVIQPRAMPSPGMNFGAPPQMELPAQARRSLVVQAMSANDKYSIAVAESVTGVEAAWLGPALPWFRRLVQAAQDSTVTDGEFIALIVRAQRQLPDQLAPLLDTQALADAMEANMGAAVVNGAVRGWIERSAKLRRKAA